MTNRLPRILGHPLVKAGYFALLLAAASFYLVRWEDRLAELLWQIRLVPVAAAFGLTFLSSFLYSYIQYTVYRQLGAWLPFWTVFRIVAISQLGKYLPGKVLFAGNFYLLSREAGVRNLHIGAAFAISMVLWILTASLCSLPALSLLQPALRYSILFLPVLLALLIHPRFLGWLLKMARWTSGRMRSAPTVSYADRAEQPELLADLNTRFYFRAALAYLATWALAGLGTYLCVAALAKVEPGIYPLALASIALGTVGGFLALFAPVGLGVREGIGTLILAPVVGAEVALLSMILLRALSVVVDLLLALLAMATRPPADIKQGGIGLGE